MDESKIKEDFKEVKVSIPQCAVIGTNEFDKFMRYNNLWEIALATDNEQELKEYFLKAKLSNKLQRRLKKYLSLKLIISCLSTIPFLPTILITILGTILL